MFLLIALGLIPALLFLYFKSVYSYWEKRGIPTPPFKYFVGNVGAAIIGKKSVGEIYADIYDEYVGYRYMGYYKFMQPGIVIRSVDLVKEILQTKFAHFRDNDVDIEEKHDLIFGKNPFALKGDRWKKVRGQITPSFTANKIKALVPLIHENCEKLNKYLSETNEASNGVGLEAKELSSKYTCENVASCAFGLEAQAFVNPHAEFREMGRKVTEPSFLKGIKQLIIIAIPSLAKLLKMQFFTDEVIDFLRRQVRNTLKYRSENNISRNDFLEVMTNLRSKINDEKEFNEDDIVAHAGGFFADGFETSSIAISYALYCLASNPDCQTKLREEVEDVLSRHNGKLSYESIQEMQYLDCFLKESLRMYIPLMNLTKVCTIPFELPPIKEDNTGPSVTVEVGTTIVIPAHALHYDENYFPEPKKFLPERFSDENKQSINKYTYLPFGEGPRMCLGQLFGVLQSKFALVSVVRDFEVRVNKKTVEPLQINPNYFLMAPVGGLWLDYKKIKK